MEKLTFYKAIVDNLPAHIQVNVVNNADDDHSFSNLWTNSRGLDFIGYSQKEIQEFGNEFFARVVHPEDMKVLFDTIPKIQKDPTKSFGGLIRVKPKKGDYHWIIWCVTVMEFVNGNPQKILVVNLNVSEMVDTDNQISILLKENLRLKNQLSIQFLTKREIEVLKLIAHGKIDKEIADDLHISSATAKTHRKNLHRKLHLKNTASLIHFALETGLA
jgi:DNA-binding CsgD family transcriptional regulator